MPRRRWSSRPPPRRCRHSRWEASRTAVRRSRPAPRGGPSRPAHRARTARPAAARASRACPRDRARSPGSRPCSSHLGRCGQPVAGLVLPRDQPEHGRREQCLGVALRRVGDVLADLGLDVPVRDPGAVPLGLGSQRDLAQQLLLVALGAQVGLPRLVRLALVDAPRAPGQRVVVAALDGLRRVRRARTAVPRAAVRASASSATRRRMPPLHHGNFGQTGNCAKVRREQDSYGR